MRRLTRGIVVVGFLVALGFGIAAVAGGSDQFISCPAWDPAKAEKCAQNILQPTICGLCLYPTQCYARAAGWNVNRNCRSAIGAEPPVVARR
jgi:hypothetical protein